jgi:hypothetical protein
MNTNINKFDFRAHFQEVYVSLKYNFMSNYLFFSWNKVLNN